MFVQKRCLFDTCFIEKKIEKKFSWLADALVGALGNETFLHEQGAVIMGPKYR